MAIDHAVPNHHAHYPGFAGATGLIAALSMIVGRGDDAELAAQLTALGPRDTLVDVGCGPGVAARHAAGLGASVTGVDPAGVMLRVARLLSIRSRRSPAALHFVEGTAESLPMGDATATVLWSIASVHHWDDLDRALGESRRVLAPGGRLLAIERRTVAGARGHASHGWTPEQAEQFATRCEAHGFRDARVETHDGNRRKTVSVLAQG